MKKYTLEFEVNDEGKLTIRSKNERFTAFELLGMLDWKKRDIENQIFGKIEPEIVSRELVKD